MHDNDIAEEAQLVETVEPTAPSTNTPSPEAEQMAFADAFRERSQVTQVVYQTLLQAVLRNKKDEPKSIQPAEAELLHGLSSAAAALSSADVNERVTGWEAISRISNVARDYLTITSNQEPAK